MLSPGLARKPSCQSCPQVESHCPCPAACDPWVGLHLPGLSGPRWAEASPSHSCLGPEHTVLLGLARKAARKPHAQHRGLGSSVPCHAAWEETVLAQDGQMNSFLLLSHTDIYINQITLILLFSSPRPLLTFPGSWFYQCYFKMGVTKDRLPVSKPWFAQCNSPVHFLRSSNIVAAIF